MPEYSKSRIDSAYAHLDAVDEVFRQQRIGWNQDHGMYHYGGDPFDQLVREIAYQGINGPSADAAYRKLRRACLVQDGQLIRPQHILEATAEQLHTRTTGLTESKIKSLQDLATRVASGDFDLTIEHLDSLAGDELERQLCEVHGIGPGTVNHYRRYTLGHLNVINSSNRSIQRGLQLAFGLQAMPSSEQAENMMEKWTPYRAVGQWHMWMLGKENPG